MDKKKIQHVVDRMRNLFMLGNITCASREIVEKWAKEIEDSLKEKE